MKRLLLLGVGSALMFTMGGVGSAQADSTQDTHKSTSILAGTTGFVAPGGARCASCHRAHTAKAEYLLKQAQPGLCYSCHGGQGSFLDVVDGVDPNFTAGMGKALRGGGFAYALLDGAGAKITVTASGAKTSTAPPATTGKAVTSRHQIDGVTTGTMWGNGAISATIGITGTAVNDATTANPAKAGDAGLYGVTLECGSCHDPHGNGNYRILKPVPSDAGTASKVITAAIPYAPAVVTGGVVTTPEQPYVPTVYATDVAGTINGINIPDPAVKEYTTLDYWKVADPNVPTVLGGPLPVYGTGIDPNLTTTVDKTDAKDGNHILVGQGRTDGFITNVAQWCTTCHTRYLAGSKSYEIPLANGTTVDKTFTYRHRGDRTDKEGASRPNCIQCHVSHGTNVTMDDPYSAAYTAPDGQEPVAGSGTAGAYSLNGASTAVKGGTAIGTSRLLRVDNRGTCQMCHNK